jgi:hypothetical protein
MVLFVWSKQMLGCALNEATTAACVTLSSCSATDVQSFDAVHCKLLATSLETINK